MTLVRTTVNGSAVAVQAVDANTSLLDLLREQLNLKGTKQGCGLLGFLALTTQLSSRCLL